MAADSRNFWVTFNNLIIILFEDAAQRAVTINY